jgi:integrase
VQVRQGLVVYKQGGSPYWQARVYMNVNGQLVHTRSMRTTNLKDARKKAEDFYLDCRQWQRGDTAMPARLIKRQDPKRLCDKVADDYLDALLKDAGDDPRRLAEHKDKMGVLTRPAGFARYFSKRDIGTITTNDIRDWLRFAEENARGGKHSASTKKRNLAVVSQFLKYAAIEGLLTAIPLLPRVKLVDAPRAWFTQDEFRHLQTTAIKLAKASESKGEKTEAALWYEMSDFVLFLVDTFLRSSEWNSLQHRHIEVVGGATPYLRIAVVRGKTRLRTGISMPHAAYVYERIVRRTGGEPDTYLFLPELKNRQTATERMRDRFEVLLKAADLKRNSLGQTRVIHSLRHSALMFRLLKKVDLHLLASNAGTSVDQLERFYCSHFSADMKLDELHKGVITVDIRKGSDKVAFSQKSGPFG